MVRLLLHKEISIEELQKSRFSFSARSYNKPSLKNRNVKKLGALLDNPPYQKGTEVGSEAYVENSPFRFIRTQSIQPGWTITLGDQESLVPIKPQSFTEMTQKGGREVFNDDVLFVRGGNVGEVGIVRLDKGIRAVTSSHILKLNIADKEQTLYVYAFLKSNVVKAHFQSQQVGSIRGLDSFDSTLIDSCEIPYPTGSDSEATVRRICTLIRIVIRLEDAIRNLDNEIFITVSTELESNQKRERHFNYSFPTLGEVLAMGRLDAGIYSERYKELMFRVTNYDGGFESMTSDVLGFDIMPGPSLEIKLLKTRVDSEEPRPGYYSLILPTNISEFGTLETVQYIGTPKQIKELEFGDVLIGESGTWRSFVLLEDLPKPITNAHGIRLRHKGRDIESAVFVRSVLSWYKKTGLFALMSVAGSGGHFSPSYFDQIQIPLFPVGVRKKLFEKYYGNEDAPGIARLSKYRREAKTELASILKAVSDDAPIPPENEALMRILNRFLTS